MPNDHAKFRGAKEKFRACPNAAKDSVQLHDREMVRLQSWSTHHTLQSWSTHHTLQSWSTHHTLQSWSTHHRTSQLSSPPVQRTSVVTSEPVGAILSRLAATERAGADWQGEWRRPRPWPVCWPVGVQLGFSAARRTSAGSD